MLWETELVWQSNRAESIILWDYTLTQRPIRSKLCKILEMLAVFKEGRFDLG